MLLIVVYQWIQAATITLQSALSGLPIHEHLVLARQTASPDSLESAVLLSLLGVLSFALGTRVGAGSPSPRNIALALHVITRKDARSFFVVYAMAAIFSVLLYAVAWLQPGLTQLLYALAGFKWAFFWLLAYNAFVVGKSLPYFCIAFAIELASSLGGFFADFRSVIIITACALLASRIKISKAAAVSVALLFAIALLLATVWTAVKVQYRAFVSAGQATQVVSVGTADRMQKLFELVSDLDADTLTAASAKLAERFAYVEIFAAVIETVPHLIPHEGGALWADAISRPFMPRLLFPEKSILDDSMQVNKYTPLQVSGAQEATSFSIGYIGETYIDFGNYGIAPVLFLWGMVVGLIYRWLAYSAATRGALGMALACAALFPIAPLETSLAKSVGLLMTTTLASIVVSRLIVPRFCRWLQA